MFAYFFIRLYPNKICFYCGLAGHFFYKFIGVVWLIFVGFIQNLCQVNYFSTMYYVYVLFRLNVMSWVLDFETLK